MVFPMSRSLRSLALLLGLALPAAGEVRESEVTYEAGSVTARAFLALPQEEGTYPGVLVVHEWWGLNDYARTRARMLAEEGYAALAVDMYGDGRTADNPTDATALMLEVRNRPSEQTARFRAAMKFLQGQEEVDREKIGAVGYCFFGGNTVLQMARNGTVGLDGVASFHGRLTVRDPNPPIPRIKARMLVCHGSEDVFVQEEEVEAFKKRMKELEAPLKFVAYKDAMHGFTNPDADKAGEEFGIQLVYNKEADQSSWGELTAFLERLWKDEKAD